MLASALTRAPWNALLKREQDALAATVFAQAFGWALGERPSALQLGGVTLVAAGGGGHAARLAALSRDWRGRIATRGLRASSSRFAPGRRADTGFLTPL